MTTQIFRGGTGNFAADPGRAAEAGRKGGRASGGNFRNDPERAKEAGRKGGKISRIKQARPVSAVAKNERLA
ncbi:hypothetical protein C7431_11149 [Pantoea allii]|uniref:Stress-induced acidophilic repeat protein n=1 Tax=Pantoea allii TaxID=574096 RepID=A0A2V2BD51_9GAMM|nr:general stress protein [Pantoea allii]PWK94313.1 hypothetical protein C7431_11149 [Pantoea allii]